MRFAPLLLLLASAQAQVIPDSLIRRILGAISVDHALKHTAVLASYPRYANSRAFFEAAEYTAREARMLGLENVRIERFPARQPMWDALQGELEMIEPESRRLASLADNPLLVAQGGGDCDVTAELTEDAGNAAGRIVLTRRSPRKATGAAGVLSAASEDFFGRRTPADAVTWGRASSAACAMMISPEQGEQLRNLMDGGKTVRLRMRVRVQQTEPGAVGMVMGEIPGSIKDQDVVIVSHLDHQKQGANDNASGSGTLLEVLRVLKTLPTPRRTIRFWWSTEIRSEREYFRQHPEEARKISMAVNLDQAGGDRNTGNNLVVIFGPDWLPSFADDLIADLAEHMKAAYARPEYEPDPLFTVPGGSRQPMHIAYWPYAPLSDHIAFAEKGVGIPAISLAVPSLHVIHTSLDTVDRLDPTWMKRSALMTLAPALWAANAQEKEAQAVLDCVFRRAVLRLTRAGNVKAQLEIELKRLESVRAISPAVSTSVHQQKLIAIAGNL